MEDPALVAVSQMRVLALEVATKLVEAIALSYPVLRDAYRGVASRILEAAEMTCTEAVEGVLGREKDPFTVNDFLQAHINKLRHDRFAAAVNGAFSKCKSSHDSWQAAKEEVAASMRSWYRTTHGVNSSANAEDMSAILEAYWHLAAKRFIDNACMILDEKIMGALVGQMQEQFYVFVHDKDRLSSFFEEDADLVKRRNDLTRKRDRLSKANAAMANIQVDANLRGGPRAVRLTIALGSAGLGLQLADENDKLVVRGYRDMPDGVVNPGFESGVEVGDMIDQVNGQQASTFQEGINLLKALPASTVATITLLRTKKKS